MIYLKALFIIFSLLVFFAPNAKAQLEFVAKADYTIGYIGFWSYNPLYEIRDTSAPGAPTVGLNSLFKVNTNIFQARSLRTALAIGTMLPGTLVGSNDSGLLIPFKRDSLKINWNTQVTNKPTFTTYTSGTGISIVAGAINNTAPDQNVSLSGSNGITTSGTYPNFTIAKTKRQETYSGATNGSGVYTVTYGTAYSATPNVAPNFVTTDPRDVIMITASSTTGFSILLQRRVDVLGLLPSYTNRTGITVKVLVTEE